MTDWYNTTLGLYHHHYTWHINNRYF